MKKTFMALLGIIIAFAASKATAQEMTITLKNGNTVSYSMSDVDSIVYVGSNPSIGVKVYVGGISHDYLYSQVESVTMEAPAAPTFSQPTGSAFTTATTVTVSAQSNATIYCTIDGTDPSESNFYTSGTGSVDVALPEGTTTVKAIAKAGNMYSPVSSASYTVTLPVPVPTFETPTGTSFDAVTTVYVVSPSEGTTYVTTTAQGAIPSSSYYNASGSGRIAVTLKEGVNYINARALVNGKYSETVKAVYYVKPTAPSFSIASGTAVAEGTTVRLTGSAVGVMIYATTDGTTPTTTNKQYWGSSPLDITINENVTINAVVITGDVSSDVVSATYTIQQQQTDNNVNRNALSSHYDASKHMYNLEWPRINDTDNNTWVEKSTSDYGPTFALEWSNSKIANRFTCYQMHAGNDASNVSRKDAFKEDPELPSATRSTLSDYSGSGFSRGHLCPSADRLCSTEQNAQTFFLSNMQPQWQSHNGGIWAKFEGYVRSQWYPKVDTLYIVKGATISDVTIDGVTSSGIHDYLCNNRLIVPKYFYMAFLGYNASNGTYQAFAIWTTHDNDAQSGVTAKQCTITIDELEQRTGIDFFCNLPDDIETTVEETVNYNFWGL